MKALHVRPDAEGAEDDHYFGGEISETGQTDGGKGAQPEGERAQGHDLCQSAEIRKQQRAGARAHLTGDGEEERDGNPVGEDENGGAVDAEKVAARDSEEDVAHVHHARIAEHPIEPLLRDRDQADINDVA